MIKIARYKYTILSAVIILIALLLPSSSYPSIRTTLSIDKIAHFVLFFIFSFAFTLESRGAKTAQPSLLVVFGLISGFIVISELLQLLTPSRNFEFTDMGFDALGSFCAIVVGRLIVHKR